MAKIIVTGANGFIGRKLTARIKDSTNHETIPISRDFGDITKTETWQLIPAADLVIHLAASTFVPDSWASPSKFLENNLNGTVNALDFCRLNDSRFIYLSSFLYKNPTKLPITEDMEIGADNPYMLSKKIGEDICTFYANSYDIPTIIFRPFNIIGTGQDEKFLIPSIIKQAHENGIVNVKDLEPRRDFLHIDDLVGALMRAIEIHRKLDIFNIASGASYSVKEVIGIVEEIMGDYLEIVSEEIRRPNEIMDTRANISKAIDLLGWRPSLTLHDALKLIIEDHRNQLSNH